MGGVYMKTFLLGLSLCLALLVGTVWWLSHGDCTALPKRLYHRIVVGEADFIGDDTRFKVWMMGSGRTPDGYSTEFTQLRASDCVKVDIETESMGSPMEAESEMEKKIRGASRVVERGPKVDLPGHPDGERAVLLFGSEARAEIVLWFKGNSRLHIIESTSLAHALACEKLIQRGYRMDPHGYVIAMGQ
jgi:hypothetical protein